MFRCAVLFVLCCCACAEDVRATLIAHCIAQASEQHRSITLDIFGQRMTGLVPIRGDDRSLALRSPSQSLQVPWSVLKDEQLCTIAETTITEADLPAKQAFIKLLGPDAQKHPLHHRLSQDILAADREGYIAMVEERKAEQETAVTQTAGPSAGKQTDDDTTEELVDLTGDTTEDDVPEDLRSWDAGLFTAKRELRTASALRAFGSLDAKRVDHRLGPDAAFFGTDDRDDPLIFSRNGNGGYNWKDKSKGNKVKDYTGVGGQVSYAPLRPGDPGLGRMRFVWTNHEGHGGPQYWHEYLLNPTFDVWWAKETDPSVTKPDWQAMAGTSGTLERPVVIARSEVSWSNCGILAFNNGLIGASGYGNNGDKYPCTRLPKGRIPTAAAITPNNEFALITTISSKGAELWVVSLEARTLAHHNPPYASLPNVGTYTRLKILGSVELPLDAPSGIASTSDVVHWSWTSELSKEKLDSVGVRKKWLEQSDDLHRYPSSGFAVIISRAESKACLVDLSPLYQAFAKAYFSDFDPQRISNEGPGPDQWPQTFDVMESATPKVGGAFRVKQPTVVACGFDTPRKRTAMSGKVFIGLMSGELLTFEQQGSRLKPIASVKVGRNPIDIALGRQVGPHNRDRLLVLSRGDRQISIIDNGGSSAMQVTKVLRDKRLIDPVAILGWDSRGANGVSVADFKGKQVVNYIYEPITPWHDTTMYPDFGGPKKEDFECCGIIAIPGYPHDVSGAEVN